MSEYSDSGKAIAKLFVVKSQHGLECDPEISREWLLQELSLSEDDLDDALDELKPLVVVDRYDGDVRPTPGLFATFDHLWKEWNPKTDAVRIARDIYANASHTSSVVDAASHYQWAPRRINPALAFMLSIGVLENDDLALSGQFMLHWLLPGNNLRRFLRENE